jgi:hypothetical protein
LDVVAAALDAAELELLELELESGDGYQHMQVNVVIMDTNNQHIPTFGDQLR